MDPTHNQSLEALDRARVMHPNTDLRAFAAGELGDPTIVTGADGARIRDRKGNEWIDGFRLALVREHRLRPRRDRRDAARAGPGDGLLPWPRGPFPRR